MVTVREAGIERRVIVAAEAFLLYLTKQGLDGDSSAARHLSPMIEGARVRRREFSAQDPREIEPGRCQARKCQRRPRATAHGQKARPVIESMPEPARMTLEPWVVERALDRLGDRRGRRLLEQQRF